jgi:hypothetical protein
MEVLKLLTGAGQTLEDRLLRLDPLRMAWQDARIARDRIAQCVARGRAPRPQKGVAGGNLSIAALPDNNEKELTKATPT